MLPLTAPIVDSHDAALLNFEQLARLLGGGVSGNVSIADAHGNMSWLANGAQGQVLRGSASGVPTWNGGALMPRTLSASGTAVNGDLILASGATTVTLPAAGGGNVVGVVNTDSNTAINALCAGAAVIFGPGCNGSVGLASVPIGAFGAYVLLEADGTNWHIVAGAIDSGWTAFTYLNSWANAFNGAYRKTGNLVKMRGQVTAAAATATTIAVMPTGYAPAVYSVLIPCVMSPGTLSYLSVASGTGAFTSGTLTANGYFIDPMQYLVD